MPPSHSPQPFLGLRRAQVAEGYLIFLSCQVTEGPVDEIIRPRPQGSSPVYEHAAEGVGSGLPVSLQDRDHGLRESAGVSMSPSSSCVGNSHPFVQPRSPALLPTGPQFYPLRLPL
ncbi:hypothetical protein GH733_002048 [Mirounga leonina]|nr:hypothetical protein GH733_002048 [Mirounga leonina]